MWILFSLGSAFFESFSDLFGKRGAMKLDEYAALFSQRIFSLIILIPLILIAGVPALNTQFWIYLAINVPLVTLGLVLYIRALKISSMSLVVPIIAITPTFLLVTSPIILRELPNFWGIIGILISTVGAYMLNLSKIRDGFLAPLKSLVNERGPRLMLCAALIFSVTANLDKKLILYSSPLVYLAIANFLIAVLVLPFVARKQGGIKNIFANTKTLMPIGIFSGIALSFQMFAISMAIVPYVLSFKRFSSLFSIGWGKLFFKENRIKERFAGALFLIAGGLVIMLFS